MQPLARGLEAAAGRLDGQVDGGGEAAGHGGGIGRLPQRRLLQVKRAVGAGRQCLPRAAICCLQLGAGRPSSRCAVCCCRRWLRCAIGLLLVCAIGRSLLLVRCRRLLLHVRWQLLLALGASVQAQVARHSRAWRQPPRAHEPAKGVAELLVAWGQQLVVEGGGRHRAAGHLALLLLLLLPCARRAGGGGLPCRGRLRRRLPRRGQQHGARGGKRAVHTSHGGGRPPPRPLPAADRRSSRARWDAARSPCTVHSSKLLRPVWYVHRIKP